MMISGIYPPVSSNMAGRSRERAMEVSFAGNIIDRAMVIFQQRLMTLEGSILHSKITNIFTT